MPSDLRGRALVLSGLLAAGCVAASEAPRQPSIEAVFHRLGGIEDVLSFPTSQERLDACASARDERCLGLYGDARAAVERLFDRGEAVALQRTLDVVGAACRAPVTPPGETSLSAWQTCRGAVAAFYFFATDEQDGAIVAYLASQPPALLRTALIESYGYRGDWVSNRPKRDRWVALVRSAPGLGDVDLSGLLEHPPAAHTGIALLDPRQPTRPPGTKPGAG